MGLMSNFRFHKKNFVKRDPKLSEYISWLRIDESGIVYNKDDSMQLTFKFRGPDLIPLLLKNCSHTMQPLIIFIKVLLLVMYSTWKINAMHLKRMILLIFKLL